VLLSLEGGDLEGIFVGIIVGEGELGKKTQWMPWWYLYLLSVDLGGAALLSLLGGVNNYEKVRAVGIRGYPS
jgi:hypothetical protein